MRFRRLIFCSLLLGSVLKWTALRAEPESFGSVPVVTNVAQFNRLGGGQGQLTCEIRFEGVVIWTDRDGGDFVFEDSSGAELITTVSQEPPLQPGDRVVIEGLSTGSSDGLEPRLGSLLVVNNDGAHALGERAGTLWLAAGKYPIQVGWFIRDSVPTLEVSYEGPGLPRQRIQASTLFHQEPRSPGTREEVVKGLEYRAYEGDWWQLPDFRRWKPIKTATTPNFDLAVRSRDHYAGLSFNGILEVPRDGRYTFWLVSDGGSQLSLQVLRIRRIGEAAAPKPRALKFGQLRSTEQAAQWSTVEGEVEFAGKAESAGWELQLRTPAGEIRTVVADSNAQVPVFPAHSRIRATGLYRSAFGADGRPAPGALWLPSSSELEVMEVPAEVWTSTPLVSLAELAPAATQSRSNGLVHIRGRVRSLGRAELVLDDGTGSVTLQTSGAMPQKTNILMEALGEFDELGSRSVLRALVWRPLAEMRSHSVELPELTTVEQIKRLKHAEALRGYPVHVRGAITWSSGSAVVIQDATAGIFVSQVPVADADGLRAGEYWDVRGVTSAQFSPMVLARQVLRLGLAAMPQPLRPTWDQLLNGSLDTQWVEVRGVVTGLRSNTVTLLTHGGKIKLDLPEARPESLEAYDGTLIRVRGCLWAVKDETTHVFKIGEVEIHNASIEVDEAAPADPFLAPRKRAADLLLYDPYAGAFQRLRVCGQVIHVRRTEGFLMDGGDGLRFVLKSPSALQPGDLTEVVGFPDLGGAAPVLREAVARRTGHAPLPQPTLLSEDSLLASRHDSTLVRLQAELTKVTTDPKEQVLGLQMGQRNFTARITSAAQSMPRLRIGSRLELTATYVGRGGDRSAGRDIDSFELLLNTPSDIRVIAQPPWWTLQRLLGTLGVLLVVLVMALVWIGLLRRQVEQRTVQLQTQIHEREQVEHQRAVEAERSRIARDLHDDLGSSLTEISLLADAGPGSPPSLEKAAHRFRKIGDKARAVVNALDVIVWLVNPRKDVLPFLAGYLASYAEEYLSASGIACRLKMPREIPPIHLSAEVRHSLFLAVKEALRNTVAHAHASEVFMELKVASDRLTIVLADNGRGFEYSPGLDGNGLANLRERLAGIGGRCEITTHPEAGTQVTLSLGLNSADLTRL